MSAIFIALIAFVSTNLDDLLLLASLFIDAEIDTLAVVAGQFFGMSALVLASCSAAIFALAVPLGFVALLGLAPLILGGVRLRKLFLEQRNRGNNSFLGSERRSGQGFGIGMVTLLTIANGGDNLSVYIPLFSVQRHSIPAFLAVFAIMTAVWCLFGYWITHHPKTRNTLKTWNRLIVPFVLIGLGLKVLAGARVLFR